MEGYNNNSYYDGILPRMRGWIIWNTAIKLKKNTGYHIFIFKGVVNCQKSRDKGPPEGKSARW